MFNLLMTCVGGGLSPQTITFAKTSKVHDICVVGIDANEKAQGRYFSDFFYKAPYTEDDRYIPFICDLIHKHNINLILPGSDEEALKLSYYRSEIEKTGCQLACPDYKVLEILSNKAETYRKLSQISGISMPAWKEVGEFDDLKDAAIQILEQYSRVVLKPSVSRGGRDIIVIDNQYNSVQTVDNARELRMGWKVFEENYKEFYMGKFPVIVMQGLEEPVCDIDILSMDGHALQVIPRRRVHSAAPNEGHIVKNNPKLIVLAETIIKEFNLSWLQDIDVMFDESDTPYVLEINPRPSGSFSIALSAGYPLLDQMVSLVKKDGIHYSRDEISEKQIVPYKALKAVCNT